MLITKKFIFHSSHFLPFYHGKCENLHGHTYKLLVTVEGPISKDGLVIDFVLLKKIVKDHVIEQLDHHHLNDIIANSSAENIAIWIWKKLLTAMKREKAVPSGVRLHEVRVWETPTSSAIYRGE